MGGNKIVFVPSMTDVMKYAIICYFYKVSERCKLEIKNT